MATEPAARSARSGSVSATSTRSRPRALARCWAAKARSRRAVAVSVPLWVATPNDAVTPTGVSLTVSWPSRTRASSALAVGHIEAGTQEHQEERVAPAGQHHVERTDEVPQRQPGRGQDLVTEIVAAGVVDPPEVIQIGVDHRQRHRLRNELGERGVDRVGVPVPPEPEQAAERIPMQSPPHPRRRPEDQLVPHRPLPRIVGLDHTTQSSRSVQRLKVNKHSFWPLIRVPWQAHQRPEPLVARTWQPQRGSNPCLHLERVVS